MHPALLRSADAGAGAQGVISELATLLSVPVALLDRDGETWRFAAQAHPAPKAGTTAANAALMRLPVHMGRSAEDLMAEWTAIPLTPDPPQRLLVVPGTDEDVSTPIVQDLIADTSVILDLVLLREEVARDRRTLARMQTLETALAALAPDESPYELALAALVEITGAEVGALGVVPVGDKRMSLVVTHGYPSVLVEDVKVAPGDGILGQVLATGVPLVTDDAARDFPQCARRRRYRSGSFLIVPLKSGGEVIGAVALADRADSTPFTQRDLDALALLLPSITIAVGRARMFDRVKELQYLATLDPLTGLHNRRYFREALAVEVQRARRQRQPLSVLILDADGFKAVNDTFGHQAGDALLKDIADVLRHTVRVFDISARIGGDEFAVLMPGSDSAAAALTGERIRRLLASLSLPKTAEGTSPKLCMSIGAAVLQPAANGEDLLADADRALYQAKTTGGDRVQVWQGNATA
jgi:diguanylate cyclase (GGDEF)-like protein